VPAVVGSCHHAVVAQVLDQESSTGMGLMDDKVVVVTCGGNGIGRAYRQSIAKKAGNCSG
jgi:hypothetical protein